MHQTPKQIARSLRAFRNAHKLGLLRCVVIVPGRDPCDAVAVQEGREYRGNVLPRLPLAQCTRARCECNYAPTGTDKLRQLDARDMAARTRRH